MRWSMSEYDASSVHLFHSVSTKDMSWLTNWNQYDNW
jgi:hypothetical protein